MVRTRTVVLAFDKFRGSATNQQITEAATNAAEELNWNVQSVALADGGEGSLETLGGSNRTSTVSDPLGRQITAGWRLDGDVAYIEMATASGLSIVGGAPQNDPLTASTYGTGELIAEAVREGAKKICVFLGGSATTDGGLGALQVLPSVEKMQHIELVVACDVTTQFTDAATQFSPQKGANPKQVTVLTKRLEQLQEQYKSEYGIDLQDAPGSGAAGGLAGGLMARGAKQVNGFEFLADATNLQKILENADLCITGEGKLDQTTFSGKVVDGVHRLASKAQVRVAAIVGTASDNVQIPQNLQVVSLSKKYGKEASFSNTLELITQTTKEILSQQ